VPSLVIVVSAVLVLSCGQTDRCTNTYTDAVERFTPATVIGVSNNNNNNNKAGLGLLRST